MNSIKQQEILKVLDINVNEFNYPVEGNHNIDYWYSKLYYFADMKDWAIVVCSIESHKSSIALGNFGTMIYSYGPAAIEQGSALVVGEPEEVDLVFIDDKINKKRKSIKLRDKVYKFPYLGEKNKEEIIANLTERYLDELLPTKEEIISTLKRKLTLIGQLDPYKLPPVTLEILPSQDEKLKELLEKG